MNDDVISYAKKAVEWHLLNDCFFILTKWWVYKKLANNFTILDVKNAKKKKKMK